MLKNINDPSFRLIRFEKPKMNPPHEVFPLCPSKSTDIPIEVLASTQLKEAQPTNLQSEFDSRSDESVNEEPNSLIVVPTRGKVKTFQKWIETRRLETEEVSSSSGDSNSHIVIRKKTDEQACIGIRRGRVGFGKSDE